MVHTIEDLTTTVNTLKRDKSELEMQVQHVHQLEKEQKIKIRKIERLTTGTLIMRKLYYHCVTILVCNYRKNVFLFQVLRILLLSFVSLYIHSL